MGGNGNYFLVFGISQGRVREWKRSHGNERDLVHESHSRTLYSRISYTNSIKSRQLIVVIELSKCNLIVMYITQFT